jgi:uncharacterized protein
MDVAVTDLRAHLREWIERARKGDELVITDHGFPVARLVGVDKKVTLQRLKEEGLISRPARGTRPKAAGRRRPTPKRPVAARVSEQRQ